MRSRRKNLKDKLWKLTSEYIRRKNADDNGYAMCVTCGHRAHYKSLQAGHFIPQAQGDAVRYDLRNIAPQCYRCNINLGGNGPEYYPYMEKTYGKEVIDELRYLSNQTVKFSLQDLEEMIENVRGKLNEIL